MISKISEIGSDMHPNTDSTRDLMSAFAIAQDVKAGVRTAADIAEATISTIVAREDELQALEFFDPALLRRQASEIDAGVRRGALSGVTVAVKDIIATKDMPTGCGTPRYKGVDRGADAACVDLLRGAGAMIIGKAVTSEFAATNKGPKTRNPLDRHRTPGGSSTGSAVAVAARYCALSVGTQTGGSVIRPASFNGVFGWKPTWAVIPIEGVRTVSQSLDTIGFFSRDAADFELVADVFGLDDAPLFAELRGLRVGVCRTENWHRAAEATRVAMEDSMRLLRSVGANVQDVNLPESFKGIQQAQQVINARESGASFLNEVSNSTGLNEDFANWVEKGRGISPDIARRAYALADKCRFQFDEIASTYDIILAPSATGEAPPTPQHTGDSAMNTMWTLLHVPVISVPGLVGASGMPVGVSLVTRRYNDRTVISVARLLAPLLAVSSSS